MTVPAWRVAWFNWIRDCWQLGMYEYRDRQMADEMVAWMRNDEPRSKAVLIPCQAEKTGHGVDT